ncbi:MAG: hypothetical protein SCH98_02675 [Deferrisomatales bacterium]|nr:hypothetical protein [Deferrisomatales bacterium]
MAFAGNPRKYAADIGEGYVLLSPVLLRAYDLGALRELKLALDLELRDTRGQAPSSDDLRAVQAKQRRVMRLNQALGVLRAFALKRRLAL